MFLNEIEMPLISCTIGMELTGFSIDTDKIENLRQRLDRRKNELEQKFTGVNLNSPKQVRQHLIDKGYGGDLVTYLVSGQAQSTNKHVLKTLAMKTDVAKDILEYREVSKLLSTYVKPMSMQEKWTGNFNQCGTITGRYSSSKPNLQNIPNRTLLGQEVRKCLIAGTGNKFIISDLSQIEPRLYAFFSQDKKLKEIFQKGLDFHSAVTESIFKRTSFSKEERFVGKTVGLATLYGARPKRLKETLFNYGVDLSLLKVSQIRNQIIFTYREAANWAKHYEEDSRIRGYVETLLKRRIPVVAGMNCVNTLIQGSCADVIKVCMLNVHTGGYTIVAQIHDEIVVRIPIVYDNLDIWSEDIKDIMENSVRLEGVPIIADTRISGVWGKD